MTLGADWLVGEVEDLLDVGSVGLYEFLWIVRGTYPDVSDEEARTWAAEALDRLLRAHRGRLVLLTWPSDDVVGTVVELDDAAWDDPAHSRPYVAITRS